MCYYLRFLKCLYNSCICLLKYLYLGYTRTLTHISDSAVNNNNNNNMKQGTLGRHSFDEAN